MWGARVNHIPKLFGPELFDGLKVKKVVCGGESNRTVTAVITEDDGLSSNSIKSIICINKKVWIGTENGLNCYDKIAHKLFQFKFASN